MTGFISYNDKAFIDISNTLATKLAHDDENGKTITEWKRILYSRNYETDDHGVSIEMLFDLVKTAFERRTGIKHDIVFERQYLASVDGDKPIKHCDAPRIYSKQHIVYMDELMISVLFEYVVDYYIWEISDNNAFDFCFPYAVEMYHYCHDGLLNCDENELKLIKELDKYGNDKSIGLVSDLYWLTIAFAFCHEIAHIYLGHTESSTSTNKSVEEKLDDEYMADELGYDVFLGIIDGTISDIDSPFLECFHDYLYVAPMILLLFYRDLFYVEYWIFGNTIHTLDHPKITDRIYKLLSISERNKYSISTAEGNNLLNGFWNISDMFDEQLSLKLMNGKLGDLLKEVRIPMDNSYEETLKLDKQIKNRIAEIAPECNAEPSTLIAVYDGFTRLEVHDQSETATVIWGNEKKLYSSKPYNISFRLHAALLAAVDQGFNISKAEGKAESVFCILRILIELIGLTTVKLSKEQADVIIICHEYGAYNQPINEDALLKMANVTHQVIDELTQMKCISIENGEIWLSEEVLL